MSAQDIVNGTASVEIFPPGAITDYLIDPCGITYGPDTPITSVGHLPERTASEGGDFDPGALHYFSGGLILVVGRDGSFGVDVRTADTTTNTLIPGVWRVRVNGEDQAWFDVRIGSPFDSEGNLIALVPEPRVTFDSEGHLQRFDVRFAQQVSSGSYSFIDMTSALRQIQ